MMSKPIVVAYASKRGSTREVAEAVAAVLRERGLAAELVPAGELRDVGRYGAVVLGGSLYRGRWHRDARRLLRRQRRLLAGLPLAVFGMGPRRDEEERFRRSRQQLERALAKTPELKPVAIEIFGGVDRDKQLDLRNWDAIQDWAEGVADAFGPSRSAAPQ